MANLNETEFKDKAPELFKGLEERTRGFVNVEIFTREIFGIIAEGRSFLSEGKVSESFKKYLEALDKIEKAEMSIRGEPLAWRLFWTEIGYLASLLFLGYVTYRWPHFSLWKGLINLHTQTAWFGALGGVTVALFGIYNHIQMRDFDPKYQLWYICKPIVGGIFGWFVYLIYFIGLISVQGIQNVDVKTPELPYAIAFLAGFSERFTIKIIDRLMSVLMTWEEQSPGASKKETPK